MKRFFAITTILCLLPLCADAQWYLFPGNKQKQKQEQKQEQEQEQKKDTVRTFDYGDELFPVSRASTVNVSLILPINAAGDKPSANFLEMYGGALLAIRDLGNSGQKVHLRVFDSADPEVRITEQALAESDIIIGPVSYNDIQNTLCLCADGQTLISPLEPKAAALADSMNVVQSPVPWTRQIDELVQWVGEDMEFGDELVLIRDNSVSGSGEQSAYLMERLRQSGLRYRSVASVNELENTKVHKYRVLIASDSDAFLTGAVRSTAISAEKNGNITLYCTSRIRSTIGSNLRDLHSARTRITAAYHIDYDAQEVKDFVLAYRALFKTEPGSFAFQGYDVTRYFVKAYSEYGKRWHKRLPEHPERGLQSDFRFDRKECDGRMNLGVRRIIYNPDLSTTLL